MVRIDRRRLLITSALVPFAACAGMSSGLPAQLLADVQTLAAGVAGILPALKALPGVDIGTVNKIVGWVGDLQNLSVAVTTSASTTAAQSPVQQIEGVVNSIVGVAAPLLAATPAGPILMAATVLLPVIEAAVGLIIPPAAPPAALANAGVAPMSVEASRLVLAAAAHQ